MNNKLIYLDNSTTTGPSEQTISRMLPFFTHSWGVPSSLHQKGQELHQSLKESYQRLYNLIGAKDEDTIILTSSGAEAINHVITSAYKDITLTIGKNQFLTTTLSEAPQLMAIERLEPLGCISKTIEVDHNGIITAEKLSEAISPRTALLSLPWANGLTGVIQPLTEITALCKQRGILLHLDASHILGKLYFDLTEIGPDFISFNGDHLHGPKGTGGLYIRNGLNCSPFILGGTDQGGLRAGPLNMPGLVGLASAAQEAIDNRDYLSTEIARLRDKLENGIQERIPQALPLFKDQDRLPHCTTISFPGIANEALLFGLSRKGICASIGGGLFQQLALNLISCGIEETVAHGSVSFSLSRYTTEDEIDRAITIICETAQFLIKTSHHIVKTT